MGTPTYPIIPPDPVPAGDRCSICWGSGKPLGDGPTPSKLEAVFSGIHRQDGYEAYPVPLNNAYILEQDSYAPCHYFALLADSWVIDLYFTDTETNILLDRLGLWMFNGRTSEKCKLFMLNQVTTAYIGGTCLIAIPEIT